MAEHKIEDTKSPATRRGARPFVGPAGAPTAARPFLRPAPAGPSARPTHAPFAPPTAGRPALGASPPVQQPASVVAPPLGELSPAELPQANAAVLPTAPPAQQPLEPASEPPSYELSLIADPVEPTAPQSPRRPITSEMVALDAFDAFDAVWSGDGTPASTQAQRQPASPLDEASLGTGDAPHPWADEITATSDIAAAPPSPITGDSDTAIGRKTPDMAMPAWVTDDTGAPAAPETEAASAWPAGEVADALDIDWSDAPSIPSADDVIASEPSAVEALGEAIMTPRPNAEEPTAAAPLESDAWSAASWPDPLLAEYAPYMPVPVESPSTPVDDVVTLATPEAVELTSPVDQPATAAASVSLHHSTFEIVEERAEMPAAVPSTTGPVDARSESGLRVSAALGRLAERVRDGEIDVSSIAPEATDVAVLASVLAALLGGSSSR